jgi:hypothetical protein
MNFKVGDTVKVKTIEQLLNSGWNAQNTEIDSCIFYSFWKAEIKSGLQAHFSPRMNDYCGMILTIKDIIYINPWSCGKSPYYYLIKENGFSWNDDMLIATEKQLEFNF